MKTMLFLGLLWLAVMGFIFWLANRERTSEDIQPAYQEKPQIEAIRPQKEPILTPERGKDKGFVPKKQLLGAVSFTQTQIDEIITAKNLNSKQAYMLNEILKGKLPSYDLSQTNSKQISQEYINTLLALGDDFKNIK